MCTTSIRDCSPCSPKHVDTRQRFYAIINAFEEISSRASDEARPYLHPKNLVQAGKSTKRFRQQLLNTEERVLFLLYATQLDHSKIHLSTEICAVLAQSGRDAKDLVNALQSSLVSHPQHCESEVEVLSFEFQGYDCLWKIDKGDDYGMLLRVFSADEF